MFLEHVYSKGLAHSSYVAGSGNTCVVVDPTRNISRYLEIASSSGMSIAAVLETHLHADFISGHIELAEATGARIYAPASAGCCFPHVPLSDGETVSIGKLSFRLINTPGHTPECAIYVVSDMERGQDPVLVFTGDTLLVGDAGRPDLFPEKKELLAGQLYHSLERIRNLPDRLEVYPAHGMGSLCGRSLSAKLSSTIGNEKIYNYALGYRDPSEFIKSLLENMPAAPDHFARCSGINRLGPPLISSLLKPRRLSSKEAYGLIEDGAILLDTRNYLHFASLHVRGAYSIDREGNLPLFAGWVLPPDKDLILFDGQDDLSRDVLDALHSVGIDNVAGYLTGGMDAWVASGLPSDSVAILTPVRLKELIDRGGEGQMVITDNRLRKEWFSGRIEGSISMPAPDVRTGYALLPEGCNIVTVCGSGARSMMAASILKQKGFQSVSNLAGGIGAWLNSGFNLEKDGTDA